MPSLYRLLNRRSRRWSHGVTEDDIYYCYRLFLRRPPDSDGLAHHRREMARGISLDEMVNQFITSAEARGPARQPRQQNLWVSSGSGRLPSA